MTTEPPRGIKANLQRSYINIITADTYQELKDAEKEVTSRLSDHGGVSDVYDMTDSINAGAAAHGSGSPNASPGRGHGAGFPDNRSNTTPISDQHPNLQAKQSAWRNLLFGLCSFHAVI